MTTTTTTTTATIPAASTGKLLKRYATLVAKADQLGIPRPTLTAGERVTVEVPVTVDGAPTGRSIEIDAVEVTVTIPQAIVVEGWEVLAAIDTPEPGEDGLNVIRSLGGLAEAELAEFSTVPGTRCDHCEREIAGRRYLVALRNTTTGATRIIGRTCAADYIGQDLDALLNWHAALLNALDTYGAPEDEEWGSGYAAPDTVTFPLVEVVSIAAEIIARVGYTRSGEDGATKDDILQVWLKGFDSDWPAPTSAPVDAEAAIAWAASLEGSSDFAYNMRAVASRTTVDYRRHLGLAAYIAEGYRRHLAEQAEAEAANTDNPGHWGTVGERAELAGTVTAVRVVDGFYGTSAWVKVTTPEGHLVEWKASNAYNAPEPGDRVAGKATVKCHGDWKGTPVTTVTRWKWALVD